MQQRQRVPHGLGPKGSRNRHLRAIRDVALIYCRARSNILNVLKFRLTAWTEKGAAGRQARC